MKPRLKKFTRNVNLSALILAIRAIVAKNPTHVYMPRSGSGGACLYKPTKANGNMGCLIGEGLRAIGISTSGLEDHSIERHFIDYGVEINQQTKWLWRVQRAQDMENPWLDCVKQADWHYPLDQSMEATSGS